MNDRTLQKQRIQNALWGLFVGDALSMPVHWYYNPENIKTDFHGGVSGYEAPRHPHPESFMVGMDYYPDVKSATRYDRPYDILHEHVRFYSTSYHRLGIDLNDRETEHGNDVPELQERFHYHHGLAAGDNTLGAHLVRVLMRTVIEERRYDPQAFIHAFIDHLTIPGRNRDPYTEIYIRRWFENYSQGLPPHSCAALQRQFWSIGAHGGIIRPLVVSLLAGSAYQGVGLAVEHQNLTHRSENNVSALSVLVPLLRALIDGSDPMAAVTRVAATVHMPEVTGTDLFARYRDARGPGNIPPDEMWELHTRWIDAGMDLPRLLSKHTDAEMIHNRLATACYPEHGLPMLLYLAARHAFDLKAALLANANAGGDNVHRGMVLGMLVGAASAVVPEELKAGLTIHDALETDIDAFADLAVTAGAF